MVEAPSSRRVVLPRSELKRVRRKFGCLIAPTAPRRRPAVAGLPRGTELLGATRRGDAVVGRGLTRDRTAVSVCSRRRRTAQGQVEGTVPAGAVTTLPRCRTTGQQGPGRGGGIGGRNVARSGWRSTGAAPISSRGGLRRRGGRRVRRTPESDPSQRQSARHRHGCRDAEATRPSSPSGSRLGPRDRSGGNRARHRPLLIAEDGAASRIGLSTDRACGRTGAPCAGSRRSTARMSGVGAVAVRRAPRRTTDSAAMSSGCPRHRRSHVAESRARLSRYPCRTRRRSPTQAFDSRGRHRPRAGRGRAMTSRRRWRHEGTAAAEPTSITVSPGSISIAGRVLLVAVVLNPRDKWRQGRSLPPISTDLADNG